MGLEKNIVTTVGLDPILLHHFIKHYKSIGVDNFYIVVWGDSKEVKYDEIVNVLKRYDLEVYEDLRDVNNGSPQFLTDIYNKITSTKPDDWWIVADLDEFAVFPKPLDKFIYEDLVYNDIDFMHGIMLDRIGKNGEFSELKYDDDIWEEIPNVGFINRFIRDNDVRWCGLLKGKYELSAGQHTLTHLLMHPDEWKEYIKDNPQDKSIKRKKSKFKPNLDDIVEHLSLDEIAEYLKDDPELTPEERFELYYEEHKRVNHKKEKTYTLDQLLKGTKIIRNKGYNDKGQKRK